MLPSVVEYLYDELDGVSDLMSPVQPLLTQAVTDDDHSKWNCKNKSCFSKNNFIVDVLSYLPRYTTAQLH